MSGFFTDDVRSYLDALAGADPSLYDAVLEAADFVIDQQASARLHATAMRARDGTVVFATVVRGHGDPSYHVIWMLTDEQAPLILACGCVET
jgi:hypothetical protein